MIQNHHIVAQLATERQRDLLAAGRGWRFSDLFGRGGTEPAPEPTVRAFEAPAGGTGSDAALTTGADVAGQPVAPRPGELRARRRISASAPTRTSGVPRAREARTPERTGS